MNEAEPLHDELVNALLPIIPRTTYQDLRRLNTLAWAITGLCLTHTVRLGAWAQVLPSGAQSASSRERRFSRWLHHPAIHSPQWYLPVVQAALLDWPAQTRLYVALDTTALTPFVLIRASLLYRGRAIPLAWRAERHQSTQVSFEAYQPVLDQVHALMPPGMVITRLSDRGFVHERLLHYLRKQQWHGSLATDQQDPRSSRGNASLGCQRPLSFCWPTAVLPAGVDSGSRCGTSFSGSGLPA